MCIAYNVCYTRVKQWFAQTLWYDGYITYELVKFFAFPPTKVYSYCTENSNENG